jgi:hypothetical protein
LRALAVATKYFDPARMPARMRRYTRIVLECEREGKDWEAVLLNRYKRRIRKKTRERLRAWLEGRKRILEGGKTESQSNGRDA